MKLWRKWVARALGMGGYGGAFDRAGGRYETARGLANPYGQSVWVQAAINLVTQPIKSSPLRLYDAGGSAQGVASDVEAFWREPAAGMSRAEWLDATCGWFKLAGEFFWILDDSWLVPGMRKSQLMLARPDRMREVLVAGELAGWELRDAAGRTHALVPEQVVRRKRWNPANEHRGLGELESALVAAEGDYLAGRYTRDIYGNAGEQGDYLISDGAPPTAEQQEQIVAALREKRSARLRGEFRPVFLAGGVKMAAPAVAAVDGSMAGARLGSRYEVFVAFGVPPSMSDVQASYSIGSASDYFRLIHGTCMPLAQMVADAVGELASRMAGGIVTADFDFDEHPVMQAVRRERIEAAERLWGMGMPLQEINTYLDMGLPESPGWDRGWLPFSLQPAGGDERGMKLEGGNLSGVAASRLGGTVAPGQGKIAAMVAALREGCPVHRDGGEPSPLWLAHWRSRQESIKLYEGKFTKVLMVARARVLGNLSRVAGARSAAVTLNFDLDAWGGELEEEMGKAAMVALDKAGRQALAELGRTDDAWRMPPARVLEFLRSRENFMRDIAAAVHREIMAALEAGIEAGESMEKLAGRVRAAFNIISKERAHTIAMTETAAAYGSARQEALEQSGVERKKWLSSGNDNVRPSHQVANGQVRKIREPFDVGGAQLMHPADGSLGAPPEEIINCHCVSIAAWEDTDL